MLRKMEDTNLNISSTALLCVDLQKCYYQPPITQLFPSLEENVTKVIKVCRNKNVKVVHVRQEDLYGVSKWLPWWEELHPDQKNDLGVPEPLACALEKDNERVFIKNTFDGFFSTGLNEYLRYALITVVLNYAMMLYVYLQT